ncbi:antibiotic biosynthesis monooxygenase [Mesobacillus maritimus]|uniref:Antibiotic biosynthesis monooxygenase n=1 Tax=Mesobacillus maritimus TaxID=1643336 RepID=A0ABS7K4F7_9BACI|nr:antibiotic biosynthesis monooxygenase [Mesobacillus maritimus]MBY0097143.1 antibiotic biosynthesis monooxygenase [Mesobacillus maritimus]
MFVQMRKMIVTEGNSDKVVQRFGGEGLVEKQEGFIDTTVMVKKVRRGDEEVVIQTRWESEEHWKQWEKSDAHIAGHKAKLGKPKPEYIISSEGGLYEVKAVKGPKTSNATV